VAAISDFFYKNSANSKYSIRSIEYTVGRILEGLYPPVININYASDLSSITKLPMVDRLKETAQKHKVKILFGVMRLGASSRCGPDGFSIRTMCSIVKQAVLIT